MTYGRVARVGPHVGIAMARPQVIWPNWRRGHFITVRPEGGVGDRPGASLPGADAWHSRGKMA